jgi:hypothetical protein
MKFKIQIPTTVGTNIKINFKSQKRNHKFLKLLFGVYFGFWVLSFGFCSLASASYITLKTTVTSVIDKDQLKVIVSTANKGDEPAYNVQAEVRVGSKKVLGAKSQEMGINQPYRAEAVFPLNLKTPGRYPMVLVMHYTDANQYPFSALNCQTFAYKTEAPPEDVFGSLRPVSFWKKAEMGLNLKNMGGEEITASVDLVVPRELTASSERIKLNIPSKSEINQRFTVSNFSALSGSNYQVYAVVEYEKDRMHYTRIIPGVIKIVEAKTLMGIDSTFLIAVFILLVVVFVVFQVIRK